MKILAVLTLAASMSSAIAGVDFGGMHFHSTVEAKQVEALKNDLRYLYQTPVTNVDQEFLSTAEMAVGDGKNMHNWLLNRVKYIIGESYELNNDNVVASIPGILFHRFPKTPMPEGFGAASAEGKDDEVKTVMINLGGALYLMGKQNDVPIGLKLDDKKVFAKSARVGILQVGEGLFYEKFLLNKDLNAPSNSISRLGTLFHEARHSDGNGKSTGFLHATCPAEHAYGGYAACEIAGNGPYTIGGLSERHLLRNCTACSEKEKNVLAVRALDSFSRIIDLNKMNQISALTKNIETLKTVIGVYEVMAPTVKDSKKRQEIEQEIANLKAQLKQQEDELAKLSSTPNEKPAFYDAKPEGNFDDLSVKQSSKLMEKSLK